MKVGMEYDVSDMYNEARIIQKYACIKFHDLDKPLFLESKYIQYWPWSLAIVGIE